MQRRPPEGGRYKFKGNINCTQSARLNLWQAGAQQAAPLPIQLPRAGETPALQIQKQSQKLRDIHSSAC
jgi:hypothetical protein